MGEYHTLYQNDIDVSKLEGINHKMSSSITTVKKRRSNGKLRENRRDSVSNVLLIIRDHNIDTHCLLHHKIGTGNEQIVAKTISVDNLIYRCGSLSAGESDDYFKQVANGVAYFQNAGITLRDLSPENFMLAADDTLNIMDFSYAELFNRFTEARRSSG
jgi:serine/threonine protein kinase